MAQTRPLAPARVCEDHYGHLKQWLLDDTYIVGVATPEVHTVRKRKYGYRSFLDKSCKRFIEIIAALQKINTQNTMELK